MTFLKAESVITINVSFTHCALFSFLEEAVPELMMILTSAGVLGLIHHSGTWENTERTSLWDWEDLGGS